MTEQTPKVRLELDSRPESVTLVRGMVMGVGETLGFDAEFVDDLKIAVSEACNNVVLHAYDGQAGVLLVDFEVGSGRVGVKVRDDGGGIRRIAATHDRMGVGLAVISALSERAEFVTVPDGGTEVRMAFASEAARMPLPNGADLNGTDWPAQLEGDIVVRLAPIELMPAVLGRIVRGLAARSRFSVDRFAELSALSDALAAHARSSAARERIGFAVVARERQLELTIGPFEGGSCAALSTATGKQSSASPLAQLADEVTTERAGGSEVLRVLVADKRHT